MARVLLVLYLVCYGCYIFYTREPDFFDGETTKGIIEYNAEKTFVKYSVKNNLYKIETKNYISYLKNNESVTVIYQHNKPTNAAIYNFWSYWFNLTEFIVSLLFLLGCFYVAVALNKNAFEPNLDNIEKNEFKNNSKF